MCTMIIMFAFSNLSYALWVAVYHAIVWDEGMASGTTTRVISMIDNVLYDQVCMARFI